MTGTEITIQVLTCSALVGLLAAVGLRLTWEEVRTALSQCRFSAILLVNFLVIPALAVGGAAWFGLERDVAVKIRKTDAPR